MKIFRSTNALLAICALAHVCATAQGQSFTASVLYQLQPSNDSFLYYEAMAADASSPQIVGNYANNGSPIHAFLWSSQGAIDLNPSSSSQSYSQAFGTNGVQQVGEAANPNTSNHLHATIWYGTPGSAVDLNPTNLSVVTSVAYGISHDGSQEVGDGAVTQANGIHALLWTNSASTAVDLNPTSLGITSSAANATDGTQQVGMGATSGTNFANDIVTALLWSNAAASAINLGPSNPEYMTSDALAVSGNQEVGYASLDGNASQGFTHAMLWTGSAASAVDLNPSGYFVSDALATNGTDQVGWGNPGTGPNALIWSDTAASVINLQTLLPAAGTWNSSQAYAIDSAGDVFGIAFGTVDNTFSSYAVEWTPVPEPASLELFSVVGMSILARPRRR